MNYYKSYDNINLIEKPGSNGVGGIHLGNWHGAMDKNYLIEHKITHVVSALPENLCDIPQIKELGIIQKRIHCEDSESFPIYERLHEAADFIHEGSLQGNVLVHCAAGISRSTTCLLSFYIKHRKMQVKDALEMVRKSRPIATPNLGFQKQLKKFEEEVSQKKIN